MKVNTRKGHEGASFVRVVFRRLRPKVCAPACAPEGLFLHDQEVREFANVFRHLTRHLTGRGDQYCTCSSTVASLAGILLKAAMCTWLNAVLGMQVENNRSV